MISATAVYIYTTLFAKWQQYKKTTNSLTKHNKIEINSPVMFEMQNERLMHV